MGGLLPFNRRVFMTSSASSSPVNIPVGDATFSCPFFASEPADRAAIESAFAGLPALPLYQSWRESPAEGFRPGWAQTAFTDDALLVLARFEDEDIFNPVTAFNEPAYEFGDVCEVFVAPEGVGRYAEIHVTPAGALWQVSFPEGWIAAHWTGVDVGPVEDLYVWEPKTRVQTWIEGSTWSAFLAVPFALLGASPSENSRWRISICRYDYTRGKEAPVESSTSQLPKFNFHLCDSWNAISFHAR